MNVKRIQLHVPMSIEMIIDAGGEPPEGYIPPDLPPIPSRWRRFRMYANRRFIKYARGEIRKLIEELK